MWVFRIVSLVCSCNQIIRHVHFRITLPIYIDNSKNFVGYSYSDTDQKAIIRLTGSSEVQKCQGDVIDIDSSCLLYAFLVLLFGKDEIPVQCLNGVHNA